MSFLDHLKHSTFIPSKDDVTAFLDHRLATVGTSLADIGDDILTAAFLRSEARFRTVRLKSFTLDEGRSALFNAFNYSAHCLLLYQLARECFLAGETDLAERLYFLNIATTSADLFYEVDLPLRLACDHPLASVIGRGRFTEAASLLFMQSCTIGGNETKDGSLNYPEIAGNLIMHADASVIGRTRIEGTVVLAKGAYLKDAGTVRDVIAFGTPPNNGFKNLTEEEAARFLRFAAPPSD